MGEQSNEPNPLVPAIISAGISAFGDLRAAAGKPEEGLYLKTMAPMFAYTAAGQLVWAQRQAERGAGFVRRLFRRAEAEGIGDELEEAADLLEQAIPLISNEPSEDKRRMMEEIILNGARRAREYGALVQAQEALDDIAKLTPSQAIVLANVCGALERPGVSERGIEMPQAAEWGLDSYRLSRAFNTLTVDFLQIDLAPAPVHFRLQPHGEVLAKWIRANPAPAAESSE